ncbi:hypothetical protein [Plantactinospora sp. CA-290183]|uniref:hypothetical protein n=1 Tax=Plantactinospora sp. CA-290183 TaxID=3240006 RepID=UPI003D917957
MTAEHLDAQLLRAVKHTARMRLLFYATVLLVALTGQVIGAVQTLHTPPIVAIPAVSALELGGVVVMANADVRRRLGERALGSRLLSAAIAAWAVAFNWLVHPDHLLGGIFAGMSALGYLVWLMHVENQRRDRLRARGALPPTTPAYELVGHWLCHPLLTRRARALAKADPGLGLYDSLAAAHSQLHRERRDAAIAEILHSKIKAAVDPTTATIAVHVYDLNEIATRLANSADYDALTNLVAADLAPARILAGSAHARPGGLRNRLRRQKQASPPPMRSREKPNATDNPTRPDEPPARSQPVPPPDATPTRTTDPPSALPPPTAKRPEHGHVGTAVPQNAAQAADARPAHMPDASIGRSKAERPTTSPTPSSSGKVPNSGEKLGDARPSGTTAAAVAYWLQVDPHMNRDEIAAKIGKSRRTVSRYIPPGPRQPGETRP